jgi:hypothetical protein
MTLGPRPHGYVARVHKVPAALPRGQATIELGDLIKNITRAQDPNLPGFDPASIVADYPFWPFHRYGPLLLSHRWLRGRSVVDRLDPRKKGIVAEDIGLGFAAHAMSRLGASPMMTKWEIGQRDRRRTLIPMLVAAGMTPRQASQSATHMTKGLSGADFVGFSPTRREWVVCESKGSVNEPPTPAEIARYVANAGGTPIGRNGKPIKTESAHQKGIRQKEETAAEVRAWGAGGVLAIAVFTSLGSEGNRRRTFVDYVDPEPPPELREALSASQPALRELICQAHYRWVAAMFGLPFNPWRAGESMPAELRDQGLTREIAVGLDDDQLRFELRIDPEALGVIATGSLDVLDQYAVFHPWSPDGVGCQVLNGPDFVEETEGQDALDRAEFEISASQVELELGLVESDPRQADVHRRDPENA